MCDHGLCADSTGSAQEGKVGLELADVVRAYRHACERQRILTSTERAALDAVERCRTAALGGHVDVCLECGHKRPSYNSCHNRHCPKCPAVAQAKWIAGRLERVLPTQYFHVVFTLPAQLRGLARANPRMVYCLLSQCAAATLLELGWDPQRLGGELGITTVLHTWTQKLEYHPHLHCIVSGGGLSADGGSWIPTRPNFLFPTQVMARLFRGKMLDALRRAASRGKLQPYDPARFAALMASLYRKRWHVYSKRSFGGAEQVIQYLGQYTHRVALSNHRLVAMDEQGVTFRTKSHELVTLEGTTFLNRWLSHILPPGFTKIRHYGLMSASHATTRLPMARRLLASTTPQDAKTLTVSRANSGSPLRTANWRDIVLTLTGVDLATCPRCGSRAIERRPLPRQDLQARAPPRAA